MDTSYFYNALPKVSAFYELYNFFVAFAYAILLID